MAGDLLGDEVSSQLHRGLVVPDLLDRPLAADAEDVGSVPADAAVAEVVVPEHERVAHGVVAGKLLANRLVPRMLPTCTGRRAGASSFYCGNRRRVGMLEMKPACEKCTGTLGWQDSCYICSYECTWCPDCAAAMDHVCPNCGGELRPRPRRTAKS